MNSAHTISTFWFAIGVWKMFARLTPDERRAAAMAASDALALESCPSQKAVEIPSFGPVRGMKLVAIVSCYIVSAAQSEHLDSPFLAAARDARKAANTVFADVEP